jgi:hypothetical protein
MDGITLIAGTWDEEGGRSSKIAEMIYSGIIKSGVFGETYFENGGYYRKLTHIAATEVFLMGRKDQVIIWMPNIPNDLPKLKDIKESYPKCILVSSKRNTDNEYAFQDIMAHALSKKSNLIIEFSRSSDAKEIEARLLDPLGNQWFAGSNMIELGIAIAKRAKQLSTIIRMGTIQSPEAPYELKNSYELEKFIGYVKHAGNKFTELIRPANGITRFLGNASFRCESGFPSFRTPEGMIYISKRNVDKTSISLDSFVHVGLHNGKVWYRGEHKPSVDTPIQLALYKMLPNINFMIHSHVYVKDAPFTQRMIPCGGLEEVDEIDAEIAYKDLAYVDSFAINLKGHGSIIFMQAPWLYIYYEFYSRPVPEVMEV